MILSHILAMSKNHVIGHKGRLPWHLPEDMKHFKQKTTGHACIMGRKTFESLKKPLPNRLNVVLSRNSATNLQGAKVFDHLDKALEFCSSGISGEEVFIIGGGELYKNSMDLVDRIYATVICKDFIGDTYYPPIDPAHFKLVNQENHTTDSGIEYSFLTYERIKNERTT